MIPVAATQMQLDALLSCAGTALGRSISASLDGAGRAADDLAALPGLVAEFVHEGSDPLTALRHNRLVLRHMHFAFLLEADAWTALFLSDLGMAVSKAEDGDWAITSGTLDQWFWCIVQGLDAVVSPKRKKLLCTALAWFERGGLGEVWGAYEKVHGTDKLYHLVPK